MMTDLCRVLSSISRFQVILRIQIAITLGVAIFILPQHPEFQAFSLYTGPILEALMLGFSVSLFFPLAIVALRAWFPSHDVQGEIKAAGSIDLEQLSDDKYTLRRINTAIDVWQSSEFLF